MNNFTAMKRIFCMLLIGFAGIATSQKMITKTGKITFEASVPSFEEVKGTNSSVTCVLNGSNGEIATLALIKGFNFKIALMEEHFNENYIESDRYPKATFKGKIENFDLKALSAEQQDYSIKGELTLHGKSKIIDIPSKIRKTDDGIEIISDFSVNTDDFNIKIPAVVKSKVSKKVDIHSEFTVK